MVPGLEPTWDRAHSAAQQTHSTWLASTDTIELNDATGSVIGHGGETIRRIQSESGATLDIDRDSGRCRIIGTEDAVEQAREAVEQILAERAEGGGGGGRINDSPPPCSVRRRPLNRVESKKESW